MTYRYCGEANDDGDNVVVVVVGPLEYAAVGVCRGGNINKS